MKIPLALTTVFFLLSFSTSVARLRGFNYMRRKYRRDTMPKLNTDGIRKHIPGSLSGLQSIDSLPTTAPVCEIILDVHCKVERGTKPCDGLIPHVVDLCSPDDHPTSITMQYIGGTCNQTEFFHCEDSPQGTSASDTSYIVATDRNNEVYFEGNVTINESFLMSKNGSMLTEDININVYSSSDQSELLQTMTLPLCSNSNSSSFHFQEILGSTKLTAFESAERGSVTFESVFEVDAVYFFNLTGFGKVHSLKILTNNIDIPFADLTDQVNSTALGEGTVVSATKEVKLDLSNRHRYTMLSLVEVVVPTTNETCADSDSMFFDAGIFL
mmetsp:Transcript_25606/g.36092  ORF Transcript_25606/g.36092 Transcript_25606/m.36092 type:complete len:327 (+) Transcript_25606:56-1036(+)